MLVLTREIEQVIEIGPDITVKVVAIRGDKVRLGIEAPKDIPVHRQEVADAIRAGEKAGKPITFADAVASQRVVSAPGAAIRATEFTLSERGRAALSGRAYAAPTLSPSDSAYGACGGDPDEQAVPARDPMGMTADEAAERLADQDDPDPNDKGKP